MFLLPSSYRAILFTFLFIVASRGDTGVVPARARARSQQVRTLCEAVGAAYVDHPEAPKSTCRLFVTHQGWQRFADVYFPPGYPTNSTGALVLQLHGLYRATWSQSAAENSGLDHLKRAAEHVALTWGVLDGWFRHKAVHVYPDATQLPSTPGMTPGPQLWNSGFWQCPYISTPNLCINKTVDDLGFLEVLTQQLITRLPATPTQVYALGFSNGGMIITKMLCESTYFQQTLTAVALISTVLGKDYMTNICNKQNNTISNNTTSNMTSVSVADFYRSDQTRSSANNQLDGHQKGSSNMTGQPSEDVPTYFRGLKDAQDVSIIHTSNPSLLPNKAVTSSLGPSPLTTPQSVITDESGNLTPDPNTAAGGTYKPPVTDESGNLTPDPNTAAGGTYKPPVSNPSRALISSQPDSELESVTNGTAQPQLRMVVTDLVVQRTVPLIVIHGRDDALFPLEKETTSVAGDELYSTLGMVDAWATRFNCSSSTGSSGSWPPLVFTAGEGVSCRDYCYTEQQQDHTDHSPSAAAGSEGREGSLDGYGLQHVDAAGFQQQQREQQPALWLCVMDGVGHAWRSYMADLSWLFFTNCSSFTQPLPEPDKLTWQPLQQHASAAAAGTATATAAMAAEATQIPLPKPTAAAAAVPGTAVTAAAPAGSSSAVPPVPLTATAADAAAAVAPQSVPVRTGVPQQVTVQQLAAATLPNAPTPAAAAVLPGSIAAAPAQQPPTVPAKAQQAAGSQSATKAGTTGAAAAQQPSRSADVASSEPAAATQQQRMTPAGVTAAAPVTPQGLDQDPVPLLGHRHR